MTAPRAKILITTSRLDFIEPVLRERFDIVRLWDDPDDQALADVRAIVCLGNESPDHLLDRLPLLGLIACFTTGYEAIDVPAMRRRGIDVSHAPGVTADPVAEFALALVLAAFRNVVAGDRMVRAGEWQSGGRALMGRSLKGVRLGIVGLGDIGSALAEKGEALGMAASWWGPRPKPGVRWPYVGSLVELAQASDVLAVCARADESSRGIISAPVIEALGPKGLLVNVARGQLVDEDALIAALRDGRLGGAALDVFATEPTPASRWENVPNLIATPHIAGAASDSAARMTALMLENLDRFFQGLPLATPVAGSGAMAD